MMAKVATAIKTALALTPRPKELSNCFIEAPSLVRTKKIPIIDNTTPTAAINIGANTAFSCIPSTAEVANAEAPKAIVAKIEPAYDS